MYVGLYIVQYGIFRRVSHELSCRLHSTHLMFKYYVDKHYTSTIYTTTNKKKSLHIAVNLLHTRFATSMKHMFCQ